MLKILVIEDHLLVREGLKQILKQVDAEAQVFEAATASEALVMAERHPDLDLVLLDISLPDRSGFDVLSELRETRSGVPVVVLSASTSPSDVRRSLQGGASGFIPKSSSAGVMLGALRLVFSGGVYLPPEILLTHNDGASTDSEPKLPRGFHATEPQVAIAELGLSERQAQVLAGLIKGKSNKAIARELGLAEQTVKAHISAVLRALSVSNRTQAVIAVAQLGVDLDKLPSPTSE